MHFEILGDIEAVETIAAGTGIREIARLRSSMAVHAGASVRALL
jgi:hypothetical protein